MTASTHSLSTSAPGHLYIADGSQTGLDTFQNMTIEAWVNSTSVASIRTIASKWDTGKKEYWFRYNGITSDIELLYTIDGSTEKEADWPYVLPINAWHHIAVTRDNTADLWHCYYDGAEIGTPHASTSGTTHNGSADFFIGITDVPSYGWAGLLDDVRVWNVCRSDEQIAHWYNTELLGTETGLVGYWKLNDDNSDSGPNGNTLLDSGSPAFSTNVPDMYETLNPMVGLPVQAVAGGVGLAID